MRKLIARLVLLALLFSVVAAPGTAAAEETKQSPTVVWLTYPSTVAAGTKVTFDVQVRTDPQVGACCGSLTLTGPSGQSYTVDLQRSGHEQLSGTVDLSPHAAAGTWRVTKLTIMDNDGERAVPTETWSLQVGAAPGAAPDIKAPVLTSVSVPSTATAGDAYTITVKASDDLSGLAYGYARLAPSSALEKQWTLPRLMLPTDTPDELQTNMLMEPGLSGGLEVVEVTLYDKAGNSTTIGREELNKNKAHQRVTDVRRRKVPEGLVTSPYLNLIHPGPTTFTTWYQLDRNHLVNHLRLARTDREKVRERIMAEVGQIEYALDALSKEIYTDPETGLRVSPFATTGKWMVLDRALDLRSLMLVELDRLAGLTSNDWTPLTEDDLQSWYGFLRSKDDNWVSLEGAANEKFSEGAASWLYVLGQSPEAVKLLKTPAMELTFPNSATFDRNVLYFIPMHHAAMDFRFEWGSAALWLPASSGQAFTTSVGNLFYELGHQLAQAHFSAVDTAEESSAWLPYLSLRNQIWQRPTGWENTPMENMSSDFAAAFLPLGLDKYYRQYSQPYPYLRNNPTMMAAFKQLVHEKQQQVIRPVTILPVRDTTVGLADGPTVSVTGDVAQARLLSAGHFYDRYDTVREITAVQSGLTRTFPLSGIQTGRVGTYYLRVQDADGRPYSRLLSYLRVPVLLDPVPRTTNQPSVVITGTAGAGAAVTVGTKTVTTSASGRFSIEVPLVKGNNDLRLTVSNSYLGAAFQIEYQPQTNKVPVRVTVPGATNLPLLLTTGNTEPLSLVEVAGGKFQADANGNFLVVKVLEQGMNKIEVKVTTPAGNTGSWVGTVSYDGKAPELAATVPLETNLATYTVTGTTEPGASLLLNDTPVTVKADGSFSQVVALTPGQANPIILVATDAAGNRTTVETSITAVTHIPQITRLRRVDLTGTPPAGATLTYQGKPVTIDRNGQFFLGVPVEGGVNTYRLEAHQNGKVIGYLEYVVTNPLVITKRQIEADGRLTVAGTTVAGYTVTVDGVLVTVGADGTFTVTIPRPAAPIKVVATGDTESYETTIDP